jgi:hypothetical protein
MNGAIPPLPQYSFMAWCSVKAQGQLLCSFHLPHLVHATARFILPDLITLIIFGEEEKL